MKKKILHAEDEDQIFQVNSKMLGDENYEHVRAKNGVEAVEIVQKLMAEGELAIILMDMHMPVKDGLSAIRDIRPQFPEIPILVVSANVGAEAEEYLLRENCGILRKPYSMNSLIEQVKKCVSRIPSVQESVADLNPQYA